MFREDYYITMDNGEKKRVRLLLPEKKTAEERFPVLYMFDGQNLFEEEDAYGGVTWGLREALEKLMEERKALPMAIVGFDNAGPHRLDEYGPWPFQVDAYTSDGSGAAFSSFLVHQIIPELEAKFPLMDDKEGRALAGSSMGGLMTAYTGAAYPDVFSSLGVFSLASWVSEEPFLKMLEEQGDYRGARIFLQVGTEEERGVDGKVEYAHSQTYIDNSMRFVKKALKIGASLEDLEIHIGAGKTHNEGAWASYMEEFLQFIQKPYMKK